MKIIQIPRRFAPDERGGTEAFVAETSMRLMKEGHSPQVMTTTAQCGIAEETVQEIGIRRFPYFYPYFGLSSELRRRFDSGSGDPFSFPLLRALGREAEVDIIHLHAGKRLGGIGRHVANRKGIPYVITLHGRDFAASMGEGPSRDESPRGVMEWGKLLGFLYGSRKVIEDAAVIICVDRDEFTAISRLYPGKRVVHLPNGIDPARFSEGDGTWFRTLYSIPHKKFLVLNVAPIDPQKNQLSLVRQLPDILMKAPDVHLLFIGSVGNRQYYEEVLKEIALQKLENHVTIIPGLPHESRDLINAYKAADCFILPSLHELSGMAVLEAWAAGLPVAAAKRGVLPHLIEHGKNGQLFDPEAPARFSGSMKDALLHLVLDRESCSAYAKAGHEEVMKRYSWDVITSTLIGLYTEACLKVSPS